MDSFSSTSPFNIRIATNQAYRRWGFAIDADNESALKSEIIADENGNISVVPLDRKVRTEDDQVAS